MSSRPMSQMAVPPNGWGAVVNGIYFSGPTYAAYIAAIDLHIRHNALEWGDAVELGNNALCARWPEGCTSDNNTPLSSGLMEQAKRFFATLIRAGDRRVTSEEAERRAAICAACHNNSDLPASKTGCQGCGQSTNIFTTPLRRFVDRLIAPLRQAWSRNYTTQDNRLGTCGICGCDLKMSVWVPSDAFDYSDQEKNAFPSFCWRKD